LIKVIELVKWKKYKVLKKINMKPKQHKEKENKKYIRKGDYEYVEKSVTEKELGEARKKATALIKKSKGEVIGLRSCWKCNPAHTHFIEKGDWSWVLNCFDCGHYYYNNIDITIYD